MSKLYFTINYRFGGDWSDGLKDKAEDCFMQIRHEWVNLVNPLINICNDLWDQDHPELKGVKLEGRDLERYDRYMSRNLDDLLLMDYGEFPGNDLFYGHCNPEYPDFRLVYKHNPKLFVDYDMVPVE